ncbi:hypothetical protein, partial [Leptospira interrogans]
HQSYIQRKKPVPERRRGIVLNAYRHQSYIQDQNQPIGKGNPRAQRLTASKLYSDSSGSFASRTILRAQRLTAS